MKLEFRGHDDRYAIEQSLLAFFPEERPVYESITPEDDDCALVSLTEGRRYATGVTTLHYHGKTARGVSRAVLTDAPDEYERERLRQRALKLSFFKAARDITGITPSWGALTGIRPGKLARAMLEQGKTERETDRVLRDTYFVSPERRRLAIETAQAGLTAKRGLRPNEISLYVGIPFCPTRCAYCSFVSQSVEKSLGLMEPYLDVLCREITDAFCVGDDNYGGGYLLAGHLIRNGHKKIAGIFKSDDVQGPERYHGMVCAMRDAGLFPLDENVLWFSSFQRRQLVELQDESLLQSFLRQQLGGCTAVVCYNDEIAFHLIRTLLRAGKRVPEDVAVVSFDNSYYSTFGPVSITSAGHAPHAMGSAAAENLLSQIRRQPCRSISLPWTLFRRQSG